MCCLFPSLRIAVSFNSYFHFTVAIFFASCFSSANHNSAFNVHGIWLAVLHNFNSIIIRRSCWLGCCSACFDILRNGGSQQTSNKKQATATTFQRIEPNHNKFLKIAGGYNLSFEILAASTYC